MNTPLSHAPDIPWTSENVESKIRDTLNLFLGEDVDDERLKDQILKVHVGYKLGEVFLKEKYQSDYQESFLNNIFRETNKYIDSLEPEIAQLSEDTDKVAYIVDTILVFFLQQTVREHNIGDNDTILEEIFGSSIAHTIVENRTINSQNVEYVNKRGGVGGEIAMSYAKGVRDFVARVLQKGFAELPGSDPNNNHKVSDSLLFKKFELAIDLNNWKFHGRLRNTGEEYNKHALRVGSMQIEEETLISLTSLIIDFLHDLKEDTNISETIKLLFGTEIDLSVEVLSKKSALKFVQDDTHDKKTVDEIIKSGLVNSNLLTSDRINSILRKAKKLSINRKATSFGDDETQALVSLGMTESQVFALANYNLLKETYGETRINEYNNRFKNKDTLIIYIQCLAVEKGIDFTASECEKIAQLSVATKARDRLDNLRNPKIGTNGKIDFDKHYAKVKETETYFLSIFREMIPDSSILRDIEKIIKDVNREASESI